MVVLRAEVYPRLALDLVGQQIGNYVATRVLGRGGMGTVYLAEHPLVGRKVAVKVLHEELAIDEQMVNRLGVEAKSASSIDSEHILVAAFVLSVTAIALLLLWR